MVDIQQLIDRYCQRCEQRERSLRDFLNGNGADFLVVQHPPGKIWNACNSIKQVTDNNIKYVWDCLQLDWTDDIPYLTPWFGSGVYANAFGCEYVFRDCDAPHVRPRYHRISEVSQIEYPDYRKSPIMKMVLDCIESLKERTRGKLPIVLTDTQSAFDTATLIVDACEFFAACYEDQQTVVDFMQMINKLIIEFSRVQIEQIGPDLVAMPGHQMVSVVGGPGISISDDNLAVSSPLINQKIALPSDQQLADAFGGIALHSCGVWTHTMPMLRKMSNVQVVECAIGEGQGEGQDKGLHDPNPNAPADVRDALTGSSIIVKARFGYNIDKTLAALDELADPQLKLIVEIGYDEENAEQNYRLITEKLQNIYER